MLPNRQKIYNVVSTYLRHRQFSRRELLTMIDQHYPGTNHDSILPSDYLLLDALKSDPSNDGNRGNYMLYPRFLERIDRDRYGFVGWDGRDPGSLTAPAIDTSEVKTSGRPSALVHSLGPPLWTHTESGSDHEKLVAELRRLAPSIRPSSDRAWRREPAVRVIDCVLSLRRPYDSFVVPRLDAFERSHPNVRTISELQALMSTYISPDAFVSQVLNYNHADRAETLAGVVNWLTTIAGPGSYAEQISNLERWAKQARPVEYATNRIRGFGIAGFQYMRMLFGANTAKPDIYICQFVRDCIGRKVSEAETLQLLERAASEAGVLLRDLDTTIWERSARGTCR